MRSLREVAAEALANSAAEMVAGAVDFVLGPHEEDVLPSHINCNCVPSASTPEERLSWIRGRFIRAGFDDRLTDEDRELLRGMRIEA